MDEIDDQNFGSEAQLALQRNENCQLRDIDADADDDLPTFFKEKSQTQKPLLEVNPPIQAAKCRNHFFNETSG